MSDHTALYYRRDHCVWHVCTETLVVACTAKSSAAELAADRRSTLLPRKKTGRADAPERVSPAGACHKSTHRPVESVQLLLEISQRLGAPEVLRGGRSFPSSGPRSLLTAGSRAGSLPARVEGIAARNRCREPGQAIFKTHACFSGVRPHGLAPSVLAG
jgi:hypothetical protein